MLLWSSITTCVPSSVQGHSAKRSPLVPTMQPLSLSLAARKRLEEFFLTQAAKSHCLPSHPLPHSRPAEDRTLEPLPTSRLPPSHLLHQPSIITTTLPKAASLCAVQRIRETLFFRHLHLFLSTRIPLVAALLLRLFPPGSLAP